MRVYPKTVGFFLPAQTDVLIRGEAGEGFEAFGKVVGVEESGEVRAELIVVFVVVRAHGGLFERAIDAFNLAIGPGVVGTREAVLDVEFSTSQLEGVHALNLIRRRWLFGRGGLLLLTPLQLDELNTVVGQDSMDFIGQRLATSARRKSAATRLVTWVWSWAKANFEVRSTATKR